MLDHIAILLHIFEGAAVPLSTAAASFYTPISSVQGSNLPPSSSILLLSLFL